MTDLIEPNIFIRHVTADDPIRSSLATQVINEIATEQRDGYITAAGVAEIVYTLQSPRRYGIPRTTIRSTILPLIQLEKMHLDHKGHFPEIFDLYVVTRTDFVDCYHAVLARALRMNKVVTLDKRHFKRFGFIPYGCP